MAARNKNNAATGAIFMRGRHWPTSSGRRSCSEPEPLRLGRDHSAAFVSESRTSFRARWCAGGRAGRMASLSRPAPGQLPDGLAGLAGAPSGGRARRRPLSEMTCIQHNVQRATDGRFCAHTLALESFLALLSFGVVRTCRLARVPLPLGVPSCLGRAAAREWRLPPEPPFSSVLARRPLFLPPPVHPFSFSLLRFLMGQAASYMSDTPQSEKTPRARVAAAESQEKTRARKRQKARPDRTADRPRLLYAGRESETEQTKVQTNSALTWYAVIAG